MKISNRALRLALGAMALPLLALSTPALAQEETEEPSGPLTVDIEVGAASDYRFRGISLSGKDPQVFGEVALSHESGFYGAVWASNVDADLDGSGNNVEVDWTLGYSRDVGPINLDVGAVYYSYLNRSGLNYFEFYGGIGVPVGNATVTLGAAYAPEQDNLGGADNTYVYISGELPIADTPLTLHGNFGIEDGAFGDSKKDWLIGASYDVGGGFTARLDYVDTHRSFSNLGKATALFTLTKSF
jgi:uncharacterized protein (TIGR02001 family)